MNQQDPPTEVVGWRERIDFPEWGLKRVRAKVDTGARTSAIDVAEIEDLPDGRIRFEVVSRAEPNRRTKWITATPVRTTIVKPSHGESQERHVCRTPVRLGHQTFEIEISLVCRRGMLCRMLLGRTAIEGHFLVDPSRRYVASRGPRKKEQT